MPREAFYTLGLGLGKWFFLISPFHIVPTLTSPSTLTTFPDPDCNFCPVPTQALSSGLYSPHACTVNPSFNLSALTRIPSTVPGSVHHVDFGRERERERAKERSWLLWNPGNQIPQTTSSLFCSKDQKDSLFLNILGGRISLYTNTHVLLWVINGGPWAPFITSGIHSLDAHSAGFRP